MKQNKIDKLLQGSSPLARKAYKAVPIKSSWTAGAITKELRRLGTIANPDVSRVQGSLNSLVEVGVVKETKRGVFSRTPVSGGGAMPAPLSLEASPNVIIIKHPTEESTMSTPIEVLSSLSEQAKELAKQAALLSSKMEQAAIDMDDMLAEKEKEYDKLNQLKTLLRDMG